MSCSTTSLRIAGALLLVLCAGTAAADASKGVFLQVRPLRVALPDGGRAWDMTPVLRFDTVGNARRACGNMAALVEAFVRDVAEAPVPPGKRGTPDGDVLAKRLLERGKAVHGVPAPRAVHLVLGFPRDQDIKDGLLPFPKPVDCADLTDQEGAAAGR